MDPSGQDIDVQIAMNFVAIDVSIPRLEKLVTAVCRQFGECQEKKYEISIAIVDDAEITRLNDRYLSHKTTTDCLSFDLSEAEDELKVFQLIANGEMAVRQAQARGHSGEAELALYIAHGLLHNLGFDDSTPSLARRMHRAEDEILQQAGYGFVYNRNSKKPKY